MPIISKPCDLRRFLASQNIKYNSEFITVQGFLTKVTFRINDDVSNLKEFKELFDNLNFTNIQVFQSQIFKAINKLSRELNDKLETEKKQGKEASDSDLEMVKILEGDLPDLVVNYCKRDRNTNNDSRLSGGYRPKHHTRKLKRGKSKTRKHRKV